MRRLHRQARSSPISMCKAFFVIVLGKSYIYSKLIVVKKTIAYSAVLFSTLVLLLSCSKSSKDSFARSTTTPDRIVNAKLAPGQTYTLSVATAGSVNINKQAAHYLVSETGMGENGSLIYRYIPASGFKGNDEVTLLHTIETMDYNNSSCNYGNSSQINRISSSVVVKIVVED